MQVLVAQLERPPLPVLARGLVSVLKLELVLELDLAHGATPVLVLEVAVAAPPLPTTMKLEKLKLIPDPASALTPILSSPTMVFLQASLLKLLLDYQSAAAQ
jgi:hypothetical protein